jgi:hypothetical protein
VVEDEDEDTDLLAVAGSEVEVLERHADAASFQEVSTGAIEIKGDVKALPEEHELHEFELEVVEVITCRLLVGPDVADPLGALLVHVTGHCLVGVPEAAQTK